jgi:hypothetical protein
VRRGLEYNTGLWYFGELLQQVQTGRIGLPDFQRRFEWTTSDVRAFLSTVLAGLPSGSLLVAPNTDLQVSLRPLESAPPLADEHGNGIRVLLDGQQRLTALYQGVTDSGLYQYGVDLTALLEGADLLQDDVVVARRRSTQSIFWSPDGHLIAPISSLFSPGSFFAWLQDLPSSIASSARLDVGDVFAERLVPVGEYPVPYLELGGDVELSVVAQIFERLNKWGQPLDSFDLLVARLRGFGWNLREVWEGLCDTEPAVQQVFGSGSLIPMSALALVEHENVRRSSVLQLRPAAVAERWPQVAQATARIARLLREFGVMSASAIPYENVAVAMVAVCIANAEAVTDRDLERFYWSACAGLRYESASNTKVVTDYRLLVAGQYRPPESWLPSVEELAVCTRRSNRALWSTILGAVITHGALDLLTGEPVVGPQPWMNEYGLVPIALGGAEETTGLSPTRLRALGQQLTSHRTMTRARRLGFRGVVKSRADHPELFGPSIDEALASQFFPPSASILEGKVTPQGITTDRAEGVRRFLQDRVDGG